MLYDEKIRLLKGLHALKQIPERQLAALSEFLRPKPLEDGGVLFQEGSVGMSLYFISSGRLRISKRVADDASKDIAILGPGEFLGEMALIEEAPRTATATALGPCLLFEFFRGDLARWVKQNSQQAVQFFAELVFLQSRRLRRTSNELILHFDLTGLLTEPGAGGPKFMAEALDRVLPHLDGIWSAAAYLAEGGGAGELCASRGPAAFAPRLEPSVAAQPAGPSVDAGAWSDERTFSAALAGRQGAHGRLLFRCETAIAKDEREDVGRTLTTVARLVASALELRATNPPGVSPGPNGD